MASRAQDPRPRRQVSSKVANACERCRRQKLKCDIKRPCTLCERANVDCRTLQTSRWIVETGPAKRGSNVASEHDAQSDGHAPAKKLRATEIGPAGRTSNDRTPRGDLDNVSHHPNVVLADQDSRTPATWDSSSTIVLVEEAFHHHHANTPREDETSAFSASQWMRPEATATGGRRRQAGQDPLQQVLSQHLKSKSKPENKQSGLCNSLQGELWTLLPSYEAASMLVNNYFDRIHWFMLLFHQRNFRNSFQQLYNAGKQQVPPAGGAGQVGYVAVLLSVCAISLSYTTSSQKQALPRQGINPESLRSAVLTTMRLRLLDILSLGSLEAVQTCVLLGSYYLYHGQPELAWPLCGCGLRIAQALNLHRKMRPQAPHHESFNQSTIAARQRCWWAVYEIETFCSMMYGFPLSITDSDCDVEELDPHDDYSASATHDEDPNQPNLLFFKCAMSKLSRIVKCALTDLYGTHRNLDKHNRPLVDYSSRLQSLIAKVADLDERLTQWQQGLLPKLRLGTLSGRTMQQQSAGSSAEVGSIESFTEHLFHLQALVLKLAYENAIILVHRPLLSYKMVVAENPVQNNRTSRDDPFQRSIRRCRDAALQISRVGCLPIFRQVSDTYAVTCVSLHLFTAGVTLCIMTSLDPLSRDSHESKVGIRGLMEMQSVLKAKSIVAAQGLDILRNLLSLVMAKEINSLFDIQSPAEESQIATNVSTSANAIVDPTSSPPQGEATILPPSSATQPSQAQSTSRVDGSCELADTTPALSYGGSTDFGFCENSSMTEALLDFEQAMSYQASNATDEGFPPVSTDDPFTRNYFVGQDQAWIWGWNGDM